MPFKYISSTLFGNYGIVGTTNNPKVTMSQYITTDNRKDWKWNYIYKPLINNGNNYMAMTVSPNIWFDEISNKWNNNTAVVMKDNKLYTIHNNNGEFYLYDGKNNEIGNLKKLTDKDLILYNNKAEKDVIDNTNNEVQTQNQNVNDDNKLEPLEKRVRPKRKFGLRK